MSKGKVSFDFDYTLSRFDVQEFAIELINLGYEVWITTSRFSDNEIQKKRWNISNDIVFETAEDCGIKKEHIVFTNMYPKIDFLKDNNFLFHLDDDEIELNGISDDGDSCHPVAVTDLDWKEQCLKIINNENII